MLNATIHTYVRSQRDHIILFYCRKTLHNGLHSYNMLPSTLLVNMCLCFVCILFNLVVILLCTGNKGDYLTGTGISSYISRDGGLTWEQVKICYLVGLYICICTYVHIYVMSYVHIYVTSYHIHVCLLPVEYTYMHALTLVLHTVYINSLGWLHLSLLS